MPELNPGYLQGVTLPFYLAVRTLNGEAVMQPEGYPTIEVGYIEPNTEVRKTPVYRESMLSVSAGIWYYLWKIPEKEPAVEHSIMMRAIIEEETVASDESFISTGQVRNPTFEMRIQVLENQGLFYPEVVGGGPYKRQRIVTEAYRREEDIGLDDFAIEGVDRIAAEYPNRIVDRRVAGRFVISGYAGRFIDSETPGGGNQRLQDPNVGITNTRRTQYRY